MRAARDRDAAVEAVITLVSEDLLGSASGRDMVLAAELYVDAPRSPALKTVTQARMARSRQALERHFDPTTSRELDTLIEDGVEVGLCFGLDSTVDRSTPTDRLGGLARPSPLPRPAWS
jgi:DNA-binding transcriptional regulator YbjK